MKKTTIIAKLLNWIPIGIVVVVFVAGVLFMPSIAFAQAATTQTAQVDVGSNELNQRLADGEPLSISVKLSNFGNGKRVDVLIKYSILNSNEDEIYSTSDTVAVETTANFIKKILVPFDISPGSYTAKTSITYLGQLVPATSQFSFTVERKILGLYQSDFMLLGGIFVILGILSIFIIPTVIKLRREMRLTPIQYSDISHDERIFYEIISDTIMQMRQRAGDDALNIALKIDGLKIDEKDGRVLSITEQPSKIIANLVSEYEKMLGQKVSFTFRKEKN